MSPASLRHRFAAHKRLGIGVGVFAAIFLLFGLLAYFWLPGYAKAKLETALSEALHRPVTVQSIDIQPYTLELAVHGFRVGEKPGSTDADKALLSVDKWCVNLSIASIARRAPVISSVSIRAPAVRLFRRYWPTIGLAAFIPRPSAYSPPRTPISIADSVPPALLPKA